MKRITVLLADDHAIVRAGLRALLEAAGDMQVIGEAENGHQAVRESKRLRPNVAVLDLAMPLLNGVEATRQILKAVPHTKVLVLSAYADAQHLRQAVAAGAGGYLLKQSAKDELLEAIRETSAGGAFFSPPLLEMLAQLWRAGPAEECAATTNVPVLSGRETEVLQLIADGYATKQIAGVLSICAKTAERHRHTLMGKLRLHKIASLTRYAVSSGVVESNRIPNWPTAGWHTSE